MNQATVDTEEQEIENDFVFLEDDGGSQEENGSPDTHLDEITESADSTSPPTVRARGGSVGDAVIHEDYGDVTQDRKVDAERSVEKGAVHEVDDDPQPESPLFKRYFQIPLIRFPPSKDEPLESTLTELPDSVLCLKSPVTNSEVFLVGTAHLSTESATEVREVIRLIRPDTVLLELCSSRISLLQNRPQEKVELNLGTMITHWKRGSLFALVLGKFYSEAQSQLNVTPGMEFIAAFEEAQKINSLVVLGDRPSNITLQRSWASISWKDKCKLLWEMRDFSSFKITAEDVELLKEEDIFSALQKEFAEQFPAITTPLILERDQFMSQLLKIAPGRKVVGVVGKAHLKGIEEQWEKTNELEELLKLPEPSLLSKYKAPIQYTALTSLLLMLCYGSVMVFQMIPFSFAEVMFHALSIGLIRRELYKKYPIDSPDISAYLKQLKVS